MSIPNTIADKVAQGLIRDLKRLGIIRRSPMANNIFTVLSNKEIEKRWLEGYKEQNLTSDEFDLDNLSNNLNFEGMYALKAVAKAEQLHTLQQVVEWLDLMASDGVQIYKAYDELKALVAKE